MIRSDRLQGRELVDARVVDENVELAERFLRFGKEALTVWTLRESARLIGRGIRVNCTSPGVVETPMLAEIATKVPPAAIDAVTVPSGRRSPPEEQAWPLLYLNSDAASYINGVDLPVDGGFAATVALREASGGDS